ncbi:hypothetical protein, partial [[Ruminococcus] lactaris]|uniref:hypothetical protein n=1 Tax=[Ruminococcus] lactaris TaxID=46228 RepID=UPI00356588C3
FHTDFSISDSLIFVRKSVLIYETIIQRGEILMRREKLFNLGILSYKTNTPKSMRFNVLGLMNYMNTELLIGMSCDLENAFDALPKFTAMLQSIEVNE